MEWNIIGHNKITHFLEQAIKNGSLSHAYLFYGPRQIGKRTLVKKFILNLMCYSADSSKSNIPCEECDQCRQIKKNIHPDVTLIKKEKDKKDITVEQIRELQDKLAVHSFFKNYKIAVIENVEQMNLASANALLKTLEEPTKKTILILTSQNVNKIPKTVLSRVQKIKLLPVSTREIFDHLLSPTSFASRSSNPIATTDKKPLEATAGRLQVNREMADHLAKLAAGRPGRALIFLYNKDLWEIYTAQLKNFFSLANTSRINRLKFVEKFLSGKETLVQKVEMITPVLNLWQLIIRDLFLHKVEQDDKIINITAGDMINNIDSKYSLIDLINLQKYINITKYYLQKNVNPRLALENLLLKF